MTLSESARRPALSRRALWLGALVLAAAPFLGWVLLPGFAWGPGDHLLFAAMAAAAALCADRLARPGPGGRALAASAIATGTGFLLAWVTLAVGIVGPEGHPLNAVQIGIVALALAGGLIARGRPRGLVVAMALAAAGQLVLAGLAATSGLDPRPALLAALPWLLAAALFGRAARAR